MSVEPYKYIIQPVAIERDGNGRIVAERIAETVTVFDADGAAQVVSKFEQSLQELQAQSNGNHPDAQSE